MRQYDNPTRAPGVDPHILVVGPTHLAVSLGARKVGSLVHRSRHLPNGKKLLPTDQILATSAPIGPPVPPHIPQPVSEEEGPLTARHVSAPGLLLLGSWYRMDQWLLS